MTVRRWETEARSGYWAVDEHRDGSTGTFGSPLLFPNQGLAALVCGALNQAYASGLADALADAGTDRLLTDLRAGLADFPPVLAPEPPANPPGDAESWAWAK